MNKNLLLLLLAVLAIFFFRNSINEFPSHIHAWSQADRYAIALGFLNNGFDFFHPQTYNLNVQFPASRPLAIEQGITAVDFPIHEYLVALLMKITGSTSPFIFRLYNLIYSLTGLFFLFKLLELLNKDHAVVNFSIIGFVFTSPVYTYYMDGFIPTVTSLANCFIAYYFYFKYRNINHIKDFYLSVLFATLAALGRTSFVVFLVAMIGQQVLSYIRSMKLNRKELVAYLISVSLIALYFIYNAYLRKVYGSVFLSSFFPASNWTDFKEIIKTIYDRWLFQYFTLSHYIFLLVIVAGGILSVVKFRSVSDLEKQMLLQVLIAGSGAFIFFILMAHQYKEHDYYFLDSFFPVLILLLTGLAAMMKFKINRYAGVVLFLVAVFFFINQSAAVQAKRNDTGSWDRYQATINNFTGGAELLAKNNVGADAKILVIDAYSPNIPFILMNRKGYSVITTSKEEILKSLKFKFDYIVIQDQFLLSDVLNNYPELKNYLDRVDGNGKITLYNYHPDEKETTLFEFLGLDKMKTVIDAQINFDDTLISTYWNNSDKRADKMLCNFDYSTTGDFTAFADSTTEYGTTFNLTASKLDVTRNHTILFEGDFCSRDDLRDVMISGYSGRADVVNYQQYYDVSTQVKEIGKWGRVQFIFNIDKLDQSDEIKVFIWNPKRKFVCYDNLRVRVY